MPLLQGCVRPPGWFFCSSKGRGGILRCNCSRILGWCCDTLGVQPLSCISIMKGLVERTHILECRLNAIGRYLDTWAWRVCCTDCFDSWAITWHNRKWLTHAYGQLEELKLFHVVLCFLNFNRCCRIYAPWGLIHITLWSTWAKELTSSTMRAFSLTWTDVSTEDARAVGYRENGMFVATRPSMFCTW